MVAQLFSADYLAAVGRIEGHTLKALAAGNMRSSRKLLYPEAPFTGGLPVVALTSTLTKVHEFGTALPMAHRIPLLFTGPARLLVRVESVLGAEKNWLRAGAIAQILTGLPGAPKKQVSRLYLDEGFFEFDGAGFPYYFEFWPYRWIADYYLEVWTQRVPMMIAMPDLPGTEPFTIDGEPFTINGVPLRI